MKLEQQVVSLELANRLKELGVKQESLFYWKNNTRTIQQGEVMDTDQWVIADYYHGRPSSLYHISAFTVAELGEMLPDYVGRRPDAFKENTLSISRPLRGMWEVRYFAGLETLHREKGTSEADARAKMLIYLLENKLINSNEN